jgi:hypothetical protein
MFAVSYKLAAYILEVGILHSHRHEDLIPYMPCEVCFYIYGLERLGFEF